MGSSVRSAMAWQAGAESAVLNLPPFASGNGMGAGGHPCVVPCPMAEIDELISLALIQVHIGHWASVYDLSQQAFALSQAVCGPFHRSVALSLELLATALFNLGDVESA